MANRRLPPLNALKAFEAAGRHEHFSKAGEELSVSHAAISRHVKELEQWLGKKLFERTGRGVLLTNEGASYLARITPSFDGILEATRAFVELRDNESLRISVDPDFASWWLVQKLGIFSKSHPNIRISIDPSEVLVNFSTSDFDAGIRFGSGRWDNVESIEIFRPNLFPVCSPEYLERSGFSDLSDLTMVDLLHGDGGAMWHSWLTAFGIKRMPGYNEASFEKSLALSAAVSNLGFALGDELLCIDLLKNGHLVRPVENLMPSNNAYYFVFPRGLGGCETIRLFANWLQDEVEISLKEFQGLNIPSKL